jgi:hypothetical protein
VGDQTIKVSDLSGEFILDTSQMARLRVIQHPALEDGPVVIEALVSELRSVEKHRIDVAIFELHLPGDERPTHVVMQVSSFDSLAKNREMSEVIAGATPVKAARQTTTGNGERIDYTAPDRFGQIHRGKITEEEARLVRENPDQANANRERVGQPAIDINDPKEQQRYGLKNEVAFS